MIGIRLTDGTWVKDFEPNSHASGFPYPSGSLTTTADPTQARSFNSMEAALEFWRQRSTSCPTRPDGKPNRPLTAFTVSIEELPR
jgi:hypothetical protein